ncbi:MAG: hypothetical protein KA165_03255, partial [Saprospiraceae bacterium]|nr:hypothetical protein [Saprospiraceae bacterium]
MKKISGAYKRSEIFFSRRSFSEGGYYQFTGCHRRANSFSKGGYYQFTGCHRRANSFSEGGYCQFEGKRQKTAFAMLRRLKVRAVYAAPFRTANLVNERKL